MKNATACLKCEHEEIWRIDPVCFYDPRSATTIDALPLACRMIENPDAGLLERPTKRALVGALVAYTCASCGYTELYARDIEDLPKLQQGEHGSKVTRA